MPLYGSGPRHRHKPHAPERGGWEGSRPLELLAAPPKSSFGIVHVQHLVLRENFESKSRPSDSEHLQ